jgi:hypothetical protein
MSSEEVDALKLIFSTNRELAEWSNVLVVSGLALEMIILWVFAKGKWL